MATRRQVRQELALTAADRAERIIDKQVTDQVQARIATNAGKLPKRKKISRQGTTNLQVDRKRRNK